MHLMRQASNCEMSQNFHIAAPLSLFYGPAFFLVNSMGLVYVNSNHRFVAHNSQLSILPREIKRRINGQ